MPTTPRVKFPYPDEGTDPWFETFKSMALALDATAYTTREDKNLVISGGGTVAFNAGTGVLSWSANIDLFACVTGYLWRIAPGSIVLGDGQLAYLTLTRAPQQITITALHSASQVPTEDSGDDNILLCLRRGSILHFRDGHVLEDGDSKVLFDSGVGGGGLSLQDEGTPVSAEAFTTLNIVGPLISLVDSGSGLATLTMPLPLREFVFLACRTGTGLPTFDRVGARKIDISSYPASIGPFTRHVRLIVDIQKTGGATSAEVQLWDMTHSVQVTGTNLSYSADTVLTELSTSDLVVGSAAGNIRSDAPAMYEVDIKMNGGGGGDQAIIDNARLIIYYS